MRKNILIVLGIIGSLFVLWIVLNKGVVRFPFMGRAQVESVRLVVEAPSAESPTLSLSVESKAFSPGFIKLVGVFDPAQMQISKVENKSQLRKSGYTSDMIYSTPFKEANVTGRYVLVVGVKPGVSVEGRVLDAIATIEIKGSPSTQQGSKQVQKSSFKIDEKESQIIALDGTILPIQVDYQDSEPEITQAETRR